MPKPAWLTRRESELPRTYKRCMTCRHVGDPCGLTNNLGKGIGRMTMYACKLHPTVRLYYRSYACEDYEQGDNAISE